MLQPLIKGLLVGAALSLAPYSIAENSKKVMITPDLYSFSVMHEGEWIGIKRNQTPDNEINTLYRLTARGIPQPMHPFEPYEVETLGEREFIEYLQQAQKDENVLIVDTRTVGWHLRLTIPGSTNIPYTLLQEEESAIEVLEELGGVRKADNSWDYSNAKTLAMFCNGYWCGQTPAFIWALLYQDYPEDKLKYYRGGMQAWTSLGLTTISSD